MKNFINIFALLLCVCIVSCDDSNDCIDLDFGIVSRDINITAAGGTMTVNLSAEGEKVVSDQEWCMATMAGKVVTITLEANTELEGRTAMVTVTRGGNDVRFPVSQPSNKVPVSEAETVVFGADAATQTIAIDHLAPFRIQMEEGVTWLKAELIDSNVVLTTQNNYTDNTLSTVVKLISGELETSILVMQKGIVLIPEKTEVTMIQKAGSIKIPVNSTRPFTATSSEAWLTIDADDESITLNAEENTSGARTATVTLVAGDLTATINVVQRVPVYADFLGDWTLEGMNGQSGTTLVTYNLSFSKLAENSTYSLKGWGNSVLPTSYPLTVNFNATNGQLTIKTHKDIGTYVNSDGVDCDVCFYGRINRNGSNVYVTGNYTCYTGELQNDGTVAWTNASVTLSDNNTYKIEGGIYYFIHSGSATSYNADMPIYNPVMTKK